MPDGQDRIASTQANLTATSAVRGAGTPPHTRWRQPQCNNFQLRDRSRGTTQAAAVVLPVLFMSSLAHASQGTVGTYRQDVRLHNDHVGWVVDYEFFDDSIGKYQCFYEDGCTLEDTDVDADLSEFAIAYPAWSYFNNPSNRTSSRLNGETLATLDTMVIPFGTAGFRSSEGALIVGASSRRVTRWTGIGPCREDVDPTVGCFPYSQGRYRSSVRTITTFRIDNIVVVLESDPAARIPIQVDLPISVELDHVENTFTECLPSGDPEVTVEFDVQVRLGGSHVLEGGLEFSRDYVDNTPPSYESTVGSGDLASITAPNAIVSLVGRTGVFTNSPFSVYVEVETRSSERRTLFSGTGNDSSFASLRVQLGATDAVPADGGTPAPKFFQLPGGFTASGGDGVILDNSVVAPIGGENTCAADLTFEGTCEPGLIDGRVTLSDFACYLSLWSQTDPAADVTTEGTANGVPDGSVTLSDFSYYLSLWSQGCP